jgi:hypothetical protein
VSARVARTFLREPLTDVFRAGGTVVHDGLEAHGVAPEPDLVAALGVGTRYGRTAASARASATRAGLIDHYFPRLAGGAGQQGRCGGEGEEEFSAEHD